MKDKKGNEHNKTNNSTIEQKEQQTIKTDKRLTKEEKRQEKLEEKQFHKEMRKENIKVGKQEIVRALETTIDPNGDNDISFGEIFGEMFSIKKDVANKEQIRDNLVGGGRVSGTNMCLLVLAIFVASIGLNVNSTAVIIGAMLISPLMGTIHAAAYGTATSDIALAVRSLMGLLMQVVISLCASVIYFTISPLSDATSELLARTNPTIWDVMIAIFGGFAGIIGVTRKEKTNVIPGVAIATALMPPLCTCGYSIAHHQWKMLLGAGYLFAANSYFIYLSAFIILLLLGVPKVKETDPKRTKRLKKLLLRNTIIMIIPSVIMAYMMVHQAVEDETVVTGFETAVKLSELNEEMTVLFPDITHISAGQMEELDENGNQVRRKLILLKTDVDMEDAKYQEEAKRIREWLTKKYGDYEVEFE
ncbi:MAG: DUF389 domain-containing protein [Eubacteriales bacterium]|nr:DUF389 domain-containing protein [Eubacteriales bacterium]